MCAVHVPTIIRRKKKCNVCNALIPLTISTGVLRIYFDFYLSVKFSQQDDSCHAFNGKNVKKRLLTQDKDGQKLVCKQHITKHD